MKLLPNVKVAILEYAEKLLLEPRQIQFVRHDARPNMVNIEYSGVDDYEFYLNISDDTTHFSYVADPDVLNFRKVATSKPEPDSLIHIAKIWLDRVNVQVQAQKRYNELLNPDNYVEFEDLPNPEERFSGEEIETLKEQVKQLQQHIDTLNLETVHKEEIKREVDLSVEKAEKDGYSKLDFKKHLIGALISTAFRLGITSENLRLIWEGLNGFVFSLQQYLNR